MRTVHPLSQTYSAFIWKHSLSFACVISVSDGKMQLWCPASMFLEDASSLDRGSTFSAICQGYLRWTQQWSSHSRADGARAPTLSNCFTSSKVSVYFSILSQGLLALSLVTLSDHIFTFICIFYLCNMYFFKSLRARSGA